VGDRDREQGEEDDYPANVDPPGRGVRRGEISLALREVERAPENLRSSSDEMQFIINAITPSLPAEYPVKDITIPRK